MLVMRKKFCGMAISLAVVAAFSGIDYAHSQSEPIPGWVRSVFGLWADGSITDDELLRAVAYLADAGVLSVHAAADLEEIARLQQLNADLRDHSIEANKNYEQLVAKYDRLTELHNELLAAGPAPAEDEELILPEADPAAVPPPGSDAAPAAGEPQSAMAEARLLMLELINGERARAGLSLVAMGNNSAAQTHADNMLEGCFAGHWGLDGLKPYMRYTLAGGYQSDAENVAGSSYCAGSDSSPETPGEGVREAMWGLMASPGHRANILDPNHVLVNIGIANDGYNTLVVQHFEHGLVQFETLPEISKGIFSFSAMINYPQDIDEYTVILYYDPPPHDLTVGQISRTYCYSYGDPVVYVRPVLQSRLQYADNSWTWNTQRCPDPYDLPATLPAPSSSEEAAMNWEEAKKTRIPATYDVPATTTNYWTVMGDSFEIKANIINQLKQHGPGVYTAAVYGWVGEKSIQIASHSIFHEIPVPDGY